MNWIIDFNIMAFVIIIIVLIVYFMRDRFGNRAGRLFVTLAVTILIATVFDIITVYFNSYTNIIPIWLNYLLTSIYYLSYNFIPLLGYIYVVEWVKKEEISNVNRLVAFVTLVLQLILIVPTSYTKWSFYFEDGVYMHGVLYEVHVIIAIILLFSSFITCFANREKLGLLKRYAVYFFVVLAIMAVVFQIFSPEVLIIDFIASLFIMVIYMTLQDPENYMDKKSECLNKKAFYRLMTEKLRLGNEGAVVFLEFECFLYVNRMLGVEAENEMLINVAEYLRSSFGKKNIFHLSYGKFGILLKNQEEALKSTKKIALYYEKMKMNERIQISLVPKMCIIKYPQIVSSLEDIMDASTYFFEENSGRNYKDIIVVDEELLIWKKRKNAILQAINRAIKAKSFQVYFQPIIDTKTELIKSAEALVRLIDEKLGFISPEEFILVAEENGCIVDIDRIVLEKVCQFLQRESLSRLGMNYVEINLSVVELMQENLPEEIFKVMDSYGISNDQISFEVTETAYMNTETFFSKNIKKLIQNGANISMDDYGTGFSNMSNLIKFPYKLVKIDKSILWEAMKHKSAKIVLENTVVLLKKIKREIVVEGVETREQVKLLQKLEVDKLQGYYYSRPISMADFIKFLDRTSKVRELDEL